MESEGRISRFNRHIREYLIERSSSSGGLWVRSCETVYLAFRDFYQDRCLLRASALTYTSFLSLVPLLALMFAVLKGFGVQNTIAPMILERLAAGSDSVVVAILEYINNTNVGRLGAFGLVALLLTVLALVSNIEDTFNYIWRVKETRSYARRFADYFSVITVTPLFMFAAISMTSGASSNLVINKLISMEFVGTVIISLLKLTPFLVMWVVFILLYLFIPNVKVKIRAAIIGGICGGTMWQLAQWGYVKFQIGVAKYNAIYGTMAALPIFMIWIYASWLILLLGLEITYVYQNRQTIHSELLTSEMGQSDYEFHAVRVLTRVAERFHSPQGLSLSATDLAENLTVPIRNLQTILADLVQFSYLNVVEHVGEEVRYQPAFAPSEMTLVDLFVCLRQGREFISEDGSEIYGSETDRRIIAVLADRSAKESEALSTMSVEDLIDRSGSDCSA